MKCQVGAAVWLAKHQLAIARYESQPVGRGGTGCAVHKLDVLRNLSWTPEIEASWSFKWLDEMNE